MCERQVADLIKLSYHAPPIVFVAALIEEIEYLLMELHERRGRKRGAWGGIEIVRKLSLGSPVGARM